MDTSPDHTPTPDGPNTADAVAHALREAIVQGRLQGGVHLRQEDLAAQFGVSRLPVREALRQLHGEGLVLLERNRGALVAALSADEVEEIYDIRIGLETIALRLAIRHYSPAILDRAATAIEELEHAEDVARWCELNWELHRVLYMPSNRPRLLKLIDLMHANVDRYLRIYLGVLGLQGRSQHEHRVLLAACARHDAAAAVATLTEHLAGTRDVLAAYLRR